MDGRLKRIDQLVRNYDRDLFAIRVPGGMIQVLRKGKRLDVLDAGEHSVSRPTNIFILALTDTWQLQGKQVEWGIEPISRRLREMDNWRDDSAYAEFVKERERKDEAAKRSCKNEMIARAYDLRRDFARATNDINTATL